jgi:hypothetical protein
MVVFEFLYLSFQHSYYLANIYIYKMLIVNLLSVQMLIGLFERCMKRRGVKESDPYDWEKVPNVTSVTDNAIPPAITTSPAILSRPQTGILGATRITDNLVEDNLITSLDNNQENIEPDNRRELEVKMEVRF